MENLEKLFEMKKEFHKKYIVYPMNLQYKKDIIMALIAESIEALNELPWKPWKRNQEIYYENFQKEIIDIWHFLINLTIAAGINPEELMVMFTEKNEINIKRQKERY
jgi:hypothetical protein